MMREISVHNDDEVARGRLETMNICSSEPEFSGPWPENDMIGGVDRLELFCHS